MEETCWRCANRISSTDAIWSKACAAGCSAPFHYYGVPDDVDYANIPWRSTGSTKKRSPPLSRRSDGRENALEQFRTQGGHARTRVLRLAATRRVHGGVLSDSRHSCRRSPFGPDIGAPGRLARATRARRTRHRLRRGHVQRGRRLPTLDTVMMLRPTESKILWLQQFGRGLRKAPGKERLTVIDYIGNHRVFLLKPQTLFGLPSGDREIFNLLERLQNGTQELPPGCEVTYELEAVEILKSLLRRQRQRRTMRWSGITGISRRCTACDQRPWRSTKTATTRGPFESELDRGCVSSGRWETSTAEQQRALERHRGVHQLARHDGDGEELQDARAARDAECRPIPRLNRHRRSGRPSGTLRHPDDEAAADWGGTRRPAGIDQAARAEPHRGMGRREGHGRHFVFRLRETATSERRSRRAGLGCRASGDRARTRRVATD